MFDDPKKELKRLEEQLLAVKESDEAFEKFYSEIYSEFGPKQPQGNGARRPASAARQNQPRNPAPGKAPAAAHPETGRSSGPAKKEKGIGGLAALVCFECLGIAAVVLWWVFRIL